VIESVGGRAATSPGGTNGALTAFKDVDVKAGDVLTLDFVDGGTKVAHNGAARGVIPGAAFNNALTRIWLGDNPAEGDLKKAMLGG